LKEELFLTISPFENFLVQFQPYDPLITFYIEDTTQSTLLIVIKAF